VPSQVVVTVGANVPFSAVHSGSTCAGQSIDNEHDALGASHVKSLELAVIVPPSSNASTCILRPAVEPTTSADSVTRARSMLAMGPTWYTT
jgi:hypothetical protein